MAEYWDSAELQRYGVAGVGDKKMERKPQKEQLHIVETEKEIRQVIAGDIQQEIENRKREMEDNLIELNKAMRGPN